MTLLDTFLDMLGDLEPVFPRHRTYRIAVRQAVGTLGTLGRHTISRIIWGIGRDQDLRDAYDAAGAADKILIAVGDGSFCNRTVLSVDVPRTHWLVRCRKDAVLCQSAFLLTTDLISPANLLIQMYFDRWEIEVNHRDEKDLLGVGEAQVRSTQSVPRRKFRYKNIRQNPPHYGCRLTKHRISLLILHHSLAFLGAYPYLFPYHKITFPFRLAKLQSRDRL